MSVNFDYIKLTSFAIIFLLSSCSVNEVEPTSNYGIKSEFVGGKTTTQYIYNSQGKIAEREGLYFYNRYIYNSDGELIQSESAMDPAMLSSNSASLNKTTLMT